MEDLLDLRFRISNLYHENEKDEYLRFDGSDANDFS